MTEAMPIAIIAASGDAPLDIAQTLRKLGHEPLIFALQHISTADFKGFDVITVSIGSVGKIIREIKKRHCNQLVFSGNLKRPPLHLIKPDMQGLQLLAKVIVKGDDQALKIIKDTFVKEGIEILDPIHIIPERYADEGLIGGKMPDDKEHYSIQLGVGALHAASVFDIGQCCIVQDERILAIEGAEGTDELIKRSGALIDLDWGSPVFIKMMKTNQDTSLDPPGFGLDTLRHCADAHIKVIALEARRVMMFDKPEVIAEADRLGITIIGFNVSDIIGHG